MEITEPTVLASDAEFMIPNDVSNWIPKAQLCDWIIQKADELNWDSPELQQLLEANPGFEPRAFLYTMVFSYLTGTFSSEDIVRCCSRDPDYRRVRPKLAPYARELSTFRKLNRALLKAIVAEILIKAMKSQFIEGDTIQFFPAGLRRYIVENATERLDIARHMDRSGEA